jgi:hypothetical protein
VALGRQDQAGQPFERHGIVTGEIAQISTGRHQERVDAQLAGTLLRA